MAVARLKTWNAGDILTASDLNAEYNNILNNGTSVAFPLTAAVSFGGFDVTHCGNITLDSGKSIIFAGLSKLVQGATIASAATTDLSLATGNYVQISGTVTITSFGTTTAGVQMITEFQAILTLTNGTAIILPGSANITTAAGDVAGWVSEGSGNWRCEFYTKASGLFTAGTVAVANGGTGQTTFTNGQLLIGNTTGNTLTKATLTAGTGIAITNGTGTISIATAGISPIVGSFTYDISTASGTQVISPTGQTKVPTNIIFTGGLASVFGGHTYTGFDDTGGTNVGCTYDDGGAANGRSAISTTQSIVLATGGLGTSAIAKVTATSASGFTLTWTKAGAPTGVATIFYTAFY